MGFKALILGKVAGPIIRHGATVAGTWLLANGYADEATVQQITGGIMAAGSLVLSLIEKEIRI